MEGDRAESQDNTGIQKLHQALTAASSLDELTGFALWIADLIGAKMPFADKTHVLAKLIAVAQGAQRTCLERAWRDKDEGTLERLMNGWPLEHLTETDLKRNLGQSFPASFRRALIERSLLDAQSRRECGKPLPEWRLNGKALGFRFADALGLARPTLLVSGGRLADLDLQPNTVVKPASGAGSAGVYLIGVDHIRDVKRSTMLANLAALRDRMTGDLESGVVRSDSWNVEAYIANAKGEPAKDIKFYCFYGEVVLALEVRRVPKIEYCWWLADGRPLNPPGKVDLTGKYSGKLFSGEGFKPAWRELAERISLEIPAPFCRVDFLSTGEDVYFGEFTPRPGGFDRFSKMHDQQLGEAFLRAESRLLRDFLKGKSFAAFNTFY